MFIVLCILKQVKQFSKLTDEGDKVDMAVGLSVSGHGEEVDDLSPRSISMLEAEEGRDGKQVHFHLIRI